MTEETFNTDELYRAAKVVYIACSEEVADDISHLMIRAALEISNLRMERDINAAKTEGEKE